MNIKFITFSALIYKDFVIFDIKAVSIVTSNGIISSLVKPIISFRMAAKKIRLLGKGR